MRLFQTLPLHSCLGPPGLIASYWDHRAFSGHVWTFSQFLSPKRFEARAACQIAECLNWSRMSWGKWALIVFTHKEWLERVKYRTLVQAPPPSQQQCDLSVELATPFSSSRWHNKIQEDTQQLFGLLQLSLVLGKALSQVTRANATFSANSTEGSTAKHSAKLLRQCKVSAWPGLSHQRWKWFCQGFQFKITPPWTMCCFQGSDPNDRRNMQRPSQCKSMSNHCQDDHRSLEVQRPVGRAVQPPQPLSHLLPLMSLDQNQMSTTVFKCPPAARPKIAAIACAVAPCQEAWDCLIHNYHKHMSTAVPQAPRGREPQTE